MEYSSKKALKAWKEQLMECQHIPPGLIRPFS